MIFPLFSIEASDGCESSPCQNGATCLNYITSYQCECAPGWTGTDCDIRKYSSSYIYVSVSQLYHIISM